MMLVDLVGADRRDGTDPPVANPIALLGDDVGDQEHRSLVVRPRAGSDFLEIGLAGFVLAEQPIDRAVGIDAACSDVCSAFAVGVPFIEQCIQRRGASCLAILAAGDDVVRPEGFVRDRAAELAIERRAGGNRKPVDPLARRLAMTKRGRGLLNITSPRRRPGPRCRAARSLCRGRPAAIVSVAPPAREVADSPCRRAARTLRRWFRRSNPPRVRRSSGEASSRGGSRAHGSRGRGLANCRQFQTALVGCDGQKTIGCHQR